MKTLSFICRLIEDMPGRVYYWSVRTGLEGRWWRIQRPAATHLKDVMRSGRRSENVRWTQPEHTLRNETMRQMRMCPDKADWERPFRGKGRNRLIQKPDMSTTDQQSSKRKIKNLENKELPWNKTKRNKQTKKNHLDRNLKSQNSVQRWGTPSSKMAKMEHQDLSALQRAS